MAFTGFGVWSLVGERLGNCLSQTVLCVVAGTLASQDRLLRGLYFFDLAFRRP